MAMDPFRLDGEVALITGAARGLGRAIAIAMAADGAYIWINDVAETHDALVMLAVIRAEGWRTDFVPGDVAPLDVMQHMVAAAGCRGR